jgi:hypothetical protein
VQFNIKATPEAIERFIAIADRATVRARQAHGRVLRQIPTPARKSEASFRIRP